MSTSYSRWADVKARGEARDGRTEAQRRAGREAAAQRRWALIRGRQLAEIRHAAGLSQAELAEVLGVSQARVSKIEHGENSGLDVVRAYIEALGGTTDLVASLGERTWKVA